MRITDILREELVVGDLKATDKSGVLRELCAAVAARRADLAESRLYEVLVEREKLGSTGIGEGIAIPHGKLAGLPGLVAVFGRSVPGVDFAAIDGKPTQLFFALFAPENSAGIHLKALARISRIFKNGELRKQLLGAVDAAAIWKQIADEDAKY
jgi:PTS system nitrogen regulatory IIA component